MTQVLIVNHATSPARTELISELCTAAQGSEIELSIVAPMTPETDRTGLAERLFSLDLGEAGKAKVFEGRTHAGTARTFYLESEAFGTLSEPVHWGLFSRAVCELVLGLPTPFDVCHCHDWQTSLIPVFFEELYAEEDKVGSVAVMLWVSNPTDHGLAEPDVLAALGLSERLGAEGDLEHEGKVAFLKGGVLYSDLIALPGSDLAERVTEEGAGGLEEAFAERSEDLAGVVVSSGTPPYSGADDPAIFANFDPEHLNGKRRCKAALQREVGLPAAPLTPLVLFRGPFTKDSGLDIVSDALDELVDLEVQMLFVGEPTPIYDTAIRAWADEFPDQIAFLFEHDDEALRRAMAGADLLCLPLRGASHPADLSSLAYGAVAVARSVGPLVDTLEGSGAVFFFDDYDAASLVEAMGEAVEGLEDQPRWRGRIQRALAVDLSSARTTAEIIELYQELE